VECAVSGQPATVASERPHSPGVGLPAGLDKAGGDVSVRGELGELGEQGLLEVGRIGMVGGLPGEVDNRGGPLLAYRLGDERGQAGHAGVRRYGIGVAEAGEIDDGNLAVVGADFDVAGAVAGELLVGYLVAEEPRHLVCHHVGFGFGEHGRLRQRFAVGQQQGRGVADGPHPIGLGGKGFRVDRDPPGRT